jgi:protein TonB
MPSSRLLARAERLILLVGLTVALPLLAAGRPSLKVYFQSTLKDAAYQKQVFEKVAATWKTPAELPKVNSKTVVQAVFDKGGKLTSAFVSMESGSKKWDEAALAAIRKAAPYPPLPSNYRYPSLEVHFHVALVP